ncbi:uncharacterized protein LOC120426161 [Culex pipiens pallens]|uniref:uncharacterized protein LOC120426161 n=1 Tax=Culex pipiens pallens TaxID=42434 RepID=UPI001952B4A0|nr:uncharacterized protein LOC120426161 [Culex pipiens pallens]
MERFIPAPDSRYDPEFPVDSDDEEEPLGGWNPSGTQPPQQEEPIAPPTYTEADLYPTIPDPSCEPGWPLACYWPVFVANFRLDDLAEQPRNAQIASYFAAKGLLTRMIFIRESITRYQQQSMLLDMLVYFTCEEDAARAIRLCHRESYYGHLLNVWPGRTPVYFDVSRSVGFGLMKNYVAEKSDTIVELILRKHHGPCVETVARFSECDVVVEFANAKSMWAAIRYTQFWMPKVLTQATQKQRFLERDVGQELLQMIADNPGFLDMVPPKEMLQELLTGRIPAVDKSWEHAAKPRAIPDDIKTRYKLSRQRKKDQLKRNYQRKRQGGERGNVLLEGAPPEKKAENFKDKRAKVKQEVDRILGNGPSAADRFKFSMLNKRNKYIMLRQAMLTAVGKMVPKSTSNEEMDLFYKMLALEEELMDLLPQCEEHFGCLQLEKGLSSAVLFAGYHLPFPECPTPESVEQFHEDIPPPNGPITYPPSTVIPTVRSYSAADLLPTALDSSCEPSWPLANLWPVYVENFRLNTLNVALRNDQIHNYFAAKGLLATRIFIHDLPKQPFFVWYQKKAMVLDMLVYFTSQDDADKAIQLCHRDSYYGHYLNVFPGRRPVFHDAERSGQTEITFQPQMKIAEHPRLISSTYFEENILEALPQDISCITRPEKRFVIFEYVQRDRLEATLPRLAEEIHRKARFLTKPRRKQRYLESEMRDHILEQLLGDPLFITAQPKPELLEALLAGGVPAALLNWNWCGWPGPRKLGMHLKLCAKIGEVKKSIAEVLLVWKDMQS